MQSLNLRGEPPSFEEQPNPPPNEPLGLDLIRGWLAKPRPRLYSLWLWVPYTAEGVRDAYGWLRTNTGPALRHTARTLRKAAKVIQAVRGVADRLAVQLQRAFPPGSRGREVATLLATGSRLFGRSVLLLVGIGREADRIPSILDDERAPGPRPPAPERLPPGTGPRPAPGTPPPAVPEEPAASPDPPEEPAPSPGPLEEPAASPGPPEEPAPSPDPPEEPAASTGPPEEPAPSPGPPEEPAASPGPPEEPAPSPDPPEEPAASPGPPQEPPPSPGPPDEPPASPNPPEEPTPSPTPAVPSPVHGIPPGPRADALAALPRKLRTQILLLGKRPRKAALRYTIWWILLEVGAATAETLGLLLRMDPANLAKRHLSPLVEEGAVERTIPDRITHPEQAYRATDRPPGQSASSPEP